MHAARCEPAPAVAGAKTLDTFLLEACLGSRYVLDISPESWIESQHRHSPTRPREVLGDVPRPDASNSPQRAKAVRHEEQSGPTHARNTDAASWTWSSVGSERACASACTHHIKSVQ